ESRGAKQKWPRSLLAVAPCQVIADCLQLRVAEFGAAEREHYADTGTHCNLDELRLQVAPVLEQGLFGSQAPAENTGAHTPSTVAHATLFAIELGGAGFFQGAPVLSQCQGIERKQRSECDHDTGPRPAPG